MPDTPNPEPKWPVRFVDSCRALRKSGDPEAADRARGELWLILNSVLFRSAGNHASRYGGVPREEIEDIAAQKALDLLNGIQTGRIDLTDRNPRQLYSYLSSVAQNGLMDLFRRHHRTTPLVTDDPPSSTTIAAANPAQPSSMVESRAYAAALRDCAERLESRARKVWIFRVFYEMSTREISSHPEIQIKPGYVDVTLQRARNAIRKCMMHKGHDTREIPTGVFVELWRAFRMEDPLRPAGAPE